VITGAREAWDKVQDVNKMEDRKDVSDRNLPPVSEGWKSSVCPQIGFRAATSLPNLKDVPEMGQQVKNAYKAFWCVLKRQCSDR